MGSVFKYIKDEAIVSEDSSYYKECQVCGKKNCSVYKASGFILKADGSHDDEDPDSEIYVACADCIRKGKVARFGEWETDDFLKQNFDNWQDLQKALRITPQIPLMLQKDDWVICCNEISEFTGVPGSYEELIEYTEKAQYWERGISGYSRRFREDGPPESLNEISKFECTKCKKRYWIDQFT